MAKRGDSDQQSKGALASLLLVMLLALFALVGYLIWRIWRRTLPSVNGLRQPHVPALSGKALSRALPLTGLVCALLLAVLARDATPDVDALINSLQIGALASVLALVMLLLWLEWGHGTGIVGSGYRSCCPRYRWWSVSMLSHCAPGRTDSFLPSSGATCCGLRHGCFRTATDTAAHRPAIDSGGANAGLVASKIFCYLKCPLMLRPALIALAVGFL